MNWALLAIVLASGPTESAVRFLTKPELKSCTIWSGSAKLGSCKTLVALRPGYYELELRSNELKAPHKLRLEVGSGKTIEVTSDVSELLSTK